MRYDAYAPLDSRKTTVTVKFSTVETPDLQSIAADCNDDSGHYLNESIQRLMGCGEIEAVTFRQIQKLVIRRQPDYTRKVKTPEITARSVKAYNYEPAVNFSDEL